MVDRLILACLGDRLARDGNTFASRNRSRHTTCIEHDTEDNNV